MYIGTHEMKLLLSICFYSSLLFSLNFRPYEDDIAMFKEIKGYRNGYVGWMGMGGSVFQWHPDLE